MSDNGFVGLVIISHSAPLAQGVAELVGQVAGPDVPIEAIGGGPEGTLGSDGGRVLEALERAARGSGSVVLMDLGSSVLSVKAALGELGEDALELLRVADAPLVEGAVAAGVMASTGDDVDGVLRAAEEARHARKL